MKAIKCDCCGRQIKFGQNFFSAKNSEGMYCSLRCCATKELNFRVFKLNNYQCQINGHGNKIFEVEEY